MILADLKAAIIAKSKNAEICDILHDAQIAATESDLINSGLSLVVYCYQNGIVDDALLAEFSEANLNAAGIYTTGSFTITNPGMEIFVMKNASVTINVTGNNKAIITLMGGCGALINTEDNGFIDLKIYNVPIVNITMDDQSMVNVFTSNNPVVTIIQNDDTILHFTGTDHTELTLTANNQSHVLAKMYNNSVMSYEIFDTATVDAIPFNNAIITNTSTV